MISTNGKYYVYTKDSQTIFCSISARRSRPNKNRGRNVFGPSYCHIAGLRM